MTIGARHHNRDMVCRRAPSLTLALHPPSSSRTTVSRPSVSAATAAAPTTLILQAEPVHFWAVADVQCQVFHEEPVGSRQSRHGARRADRTGTALPPSDGSSAAALFKAVPPFLSRVDRVSCLQTLAQRSRETADSGRM